MAISFVGLNTANTTVVNFPAGTQAGDLAIILAGRATTSPPGKPGGFTDIGLRFGTAWSARYAYKFLLPGDISLGQSSGWTSAGKLTLGIWRGVNSIGAGSDVLAENPNGNIITFPARTGLNSNADWQVAFAQDTVSTINVAALTGYTNRGAGSALHGLWDSNGPTAGIAQQTITGLTTAQANIGVTIALIGPIARDPFGREGFFGL